MGVKELLPEAQWSQQDDGHSSGYKLNAENISSLPVKIWVIVWSSFYETFICQEPRIPRTPSANGFCRGPQGFTYILIGFLKRFLLVKTTMIRSFEWKLGSKLLGRGAISYKPWPYSDITNLMCYPSPATRIYMKLEQVLLIRWGWMLGSFQLLLWSIIRVYVCSCMCSCLWMCNFIFLCQGQRMTSGVFSNCFPPYFLMEGLTLTPELLDPSRWASQQTPGIPLTLSAQYWDFWHTSF